MPPGLKEQAQRLRVIVGDQRRFGGFAHRGENGIPVFQVSSDQIKTQGVRTAGSGNQYKPGAWYKPPYKNDNVICYYNDWARIAVFLPF